MILLTGAAGFIGSCMLSFLNQKGNNDIIIVDDFSKKEKENNWKNKNYTKIIDRNELFNYLNQETTDIEYIIHLGARTDTTEKKWAIFEELNIEYSKSLFLFATKNNIPFIYASSAATYGNGELGFKDSHDIINHLIPLNPYGKSKNDFDRWILTQKNKPNKWYGFKFFNVYGPNEYHKGRMASVILHTFRQIKSTNKMKLFRSHHVDFKNGEQKRDFIYVKDLIQILYLFTQHKIENGIYNLGTGKARTFLDLANNVFDSLKIKSDISFIDTPIDIRNNYQYFTEADSNKLSSALENHMTFHSLEEGVKDYVQNYLIPNNHY